MTRDEWKAEIESQQAEKKRAIDGQIVGLLAEPKTIADLMAHGFNKMAVRKSLERLELAGLVTHEVFSDELNGQCPRSHYTRRDANQKPKNRLCR
jgi:predicted ArsR family transcriptional regulator